MGKRVKSGGQVSDGQVSRGTDSNGRVYKVMGLALLCVTAAAVGGLSYAVWRVDSTPSEPNEPHFAKPTSSYVTAEELGIKGKMCTVRFPAGYKVRIILQLWAEGKVQWHVVKDCWLTDPNIPGWFQTGVTTIDATEFQPNPEKEIKVNAFMPLGEHYFGWYDKGGDGGFRQDHGRDTPLVLSPEDVGQNKIVSTVTYGGIVDFFRIPTAADLEKTRLFTAVWVRLEKLTPEDRNSALSDTNKQMGFVTKFIKLNISTQ